MSKENPDPEHVVDPKEGLPEHDRAEIIEWDAIKVSTSDALLADLDHLSDEDKLLSGWFTPRQRFHFQWRLLHRYGIILAPGEHHDMIGMVRDGRAEMVRSEDSQKKGEICALYQISHVRSGVLVLAIVNTTKWQFVTAVPPGSYRQTQRGWTAVQRPTHVPLRDNFRDNPPERLYVPHEVETVARIHRRRLSELTYLELDKLDRENRVRVEALNLQKQRQQDDHEERMRALDLAHQRNMEEARLANMAIRKEQATVLAQADAAMPDLSVEDILEGRLRVKIRMIAMQHEDAQRAREHKLKMAEITAREEVARRKEKDYCFLEYIRSTMTGEQYSEIWEKVREMFPDAECFAERPKGMDH